VLAFLPTPARPESDPVVPQMQSRDETLVRTSELIVVKSAERRVIMILLGKNTNLEPVSKISERIEVVASDNLHLVKSPKREERPVRREEEPLRRC
jgi:hypothetical protein